MRAVVLHDYGPPSALKVEELPDPTPKPGEILVRMAGASVNPVDWKQRSGAARERMPLTFPAVLGRDVSGTVVSVGPGVDDPALALGAHVLGRPAKSGGYAELVAAPVDAWAPLPVGMDVADAGALPLVVLTGAQLAEEAVDAQPGQTVLITGATGSVGRTAVFCAKARGARVLAGVRRKHAAAAELLGADGIVVLDDPKAVAAMPTVDGIGDTVSGELIQRLLDKLAPGGTLGSVLGAPAGAAERGFTVRAIFTHQDAPRLGALARAVAAGQFTVPIARRFALAEASDAHAFAEQGAGGKVLLIG